LGRKPSNPNREGYKNGVYVPIKKLPSIWQRRRWDMMFRFPCNRSFEEIEGDPPPSPCVCSACKDHEICLDYFSTYCDASKIPPFEAYRSRYKMGTKGGRVRWSKQMEFNLGEFK